MGFTEGGERISQHPFAALERFKFGVKLAIGKVCRHQCQAIVHGFHCQVGRPHFTLEQLFRFVGFGVVCGQVPACRTLGVKIPEHGA